MFLTVILSVWAAMHLYVFWRLGWVPWVATHVSRRTAVLVAIMLWSSYPLARMLEARGFQALAGPPEGVGANWIGILFLLLSAILVVDVVGLGGLLAPRLAPALPGWAVLIALLLSGVAMVQGLRRRWCTIRKLNLLGCPKRERGWWWWRFRTRTSAL